MRKLLSKSLFQFYQRQRPWTRATDRLPSPIWCASRMCLVAQSRLTLCDSMNYSVSMGILQARILEWVAFPFSRDLPNPGIKFGSPAWQGDSLPSEPPGKSKNTGLLPWRIPSPGTLPDPGIEPGSPALLVNSLPFEPQGKPRQFQHHRQFLGGPATMWPTHRNLSPAWLPESRPSLLSSSLWPPFPILHVFTQG